MHQASLLTTTIPFERQPRHLHLPLRSPESRVEPLETYRLLRHLEQGTVFAHHLSGMQSSKLPFAKFQFWTSTTALNHPEKRSIASGDLREGYLLTFLAVLLAYIPSAKGHQ